MADDIKNDEKVDKELEELLAMSNGDNALSDLNEIDAQSGPIEGLAGTVGMVARDRFDPAELVKMSTKSLRNIMPEYAANPIDQVEDIHYGISEVLEKEGNVLRRSLANTIGGLTEILPESTAKKALQRFRRWVAGDMDEGTKEKELSEDEKIAQEVAKIFGEQTFESQVSAIESRIEALKSKGETELLSIIASNLEKQTGFKLKIENDYYKRSLELQFKQTLFLGKIVEGVGKLAEFVPKQLEAILKNTALPDIAKTKSREYLEHMMKEKAFEGGFNLIKKSTVSQSLVKHIKSFVSEKAAQAQEALGMVDQMVDVNKMAKEMGLPPGYFLADMVISGMMSKGTEKIAEQLYSKFKETEKGQDFEKVMSKFHNDPRAALLELAEELESKEGKESESITGRVKEKLKQPLINTIRFLAEGIKKDTVASIELNREDKNAATLFDNKVKKSVTFVIPTLLSKILAEVRAIRTKTEPKSELVYDYDRNKFVTTGELKTRALREVIAAGKKVSEDLNVEIIDKIFGKLTNEERKRVREALLEHVLSGGSTDIRYMDKTGFLSRFNDNKKLKNKIKKVIEKNKKNPNVEDISKFSNYLKSLTETIESGYSGVKEQILKLNELGRTDIIEELGLLSKSDHSVINSDRLKNMVSKQVRRYATGEKANMSADEVTNKAKVKELKKTIETVLKSDKFNWVDETKRNIIEEHLKTLTPDQLLALREKYQKSDYKFIKALMEKEVPQVEKSKEKEEDKKSETIQTTIREVNRDIMRFKSYIPPEELKDTIDKYKEALMFRPIPDKPLIFRDLYRKERSIGLDRLRENIEGVNPVNILDKLQFRQQPKPIVQEPKPIAVRETVSKIKESLLSATKEKESELSGVISVLNKLTSVVEEKLTTVIDILKDISSKISKLIKPEETVKETTGKTRGFRSGGYTGRGMSTDVAGIVHRDEYVINREKLTRLEEIAKQLTFYVQKDQITKEKSVTRENALDKLLESTKKVMERVKTGIDSNCNQELLDKLDELIAVTKSGFRIVKISIEDKLVKTFKDVSITISSLFSKDNLEELKQKATEKYNEILNDIKEFDKEKVKEKAKEHLDKAKEVGKQKIDELKSTIKDKTDIDIDQKIEEAKDYLSKKREEIEGTKAYQYLEEKYKSISKEVSEKLNKTNLEETYKTAEEMFNRLKNTVTEKLVGKEYTFTPELKRPIITTTPYQRTGKDILNTSKDVLNKGKDALNSFLNDAKSKLDNVVESVTKDESPVFTTVPTVNLLKTKKYTDVYPFKSDLANKVFRTINKLVSEVPGNLQDKVRKQMGELSKLFDKHGRELLIKILSNTELPKTDEEAERTYLEILKSIDPTGDLIKQLSRKTRNLIGWMYKLHLFAISLAQSGLMTLASGIESAPTLVSKAKNFIVGLLPEPIRSKVEGLLETKPGQYVRSMFKRTAKILGAGLKTMSRELGVLRKEGKELFFDKYGNFRLPNVWKLSKFVGKTYYKSAVAFGKGYKVMAKETLGAAKDTAGLATAALSKLIGLDRRKAMILIEKSPLPARVKKDLLSGRITIHDLEGILSEEDFIKFTEWLKAKENAKLSLGGQVKALFGLGKDVTKAAGKGFFKSAVKSGEVYGEALDKLKPVAKGAAGLGWNAFMSFLGIPPSNKETTSKQQSDNIQHTPQTPKTEEKITETKETKEHKKPTSETQTGLVDELLKGISDLINVIKEEKGETVKSEEKPPTSEKKTTITTVTEDVTEKEEKVTKKKEDVDEKLLEAINKLNRNIDDIKPPKPDVFDKDGDGLRDGSWRTRLKRMREPDSKESKKDTIKPEPKHDKESKSNWLNWLTPLAGVIALGIKKVIGDGGKLLLSGFKHILWEPIKWLGKHLLTGLGKVFKGAISGIASVMKNLGGGLKGLLTHTGATAATVATKIVPKSVKNVVKSTGSFITKVKDKVSKFLKVVTPTKLKSFLSTLKTKILTKLGPKLGAKYIAKFGSRLIPGVGTALLAYDAAKIAYYMAHDGLSFKSAASKQLLGFDIFDDKQPPVDPDTGELVKPEIPENKRSYTVDVVTNKPDTIHLETNINVNKRRKAIIEAKEDELKRKVANEKETADNKQKAILDRHTHVLTVTAKSNEKAVREQQLTNKILKASLDVQTEMLRVLKDIAEHTKNLPTTRHSPEISQHAYTSKSYGVEHYHSGPVKLSREDF